MSDTNIPRSIAGLPVTEVCEIVRPRGGGHPDHELCGVRVRGASLEGTGIHDNDLLIVWLREHEVEQGDLAAVKTPDGLPGRLLSRGHG